MYSCPMVISWLSPSRPGPQLGTLRTEARAEGGFEGHRDFYGFFVDLTMKRIGRLAVIKNGNG
jgi:hypothetical protein